MAGIGVGQGAFEGNVAQTKLNLEAARQRSESRRFKEQLAFEREKSANELASRENIANADRASRENIAGADRLSREEIARNDLVSRAYIANNELKVREKEMEGRILVAGLEMDSREEIAEEQRKLEREKLKAENEQSAWSRSWGDRLNEQKQQSMAIENERTRAILDQYLATQDEELAQMNNRAALRDSANTALYFAGMRAPGGKVAPSVIAAHNEEFPEDLIDGTSFDEFGNFLIHRPNSADGNEWEIVNPATQKTMREALFGEQMGPAEGAYTSKSKPSAGDDRVAVVNAVLKNPNVLTSITSYVDSMPEDSEDAVAKKNQMRSGLNGLNEYILGMFAPQAGGGHDPLSVAQGMATGDAAVDATIGAIGAANASK